MNWPRDWPHLKNKIPAFEWHEGSRARRINQVLSAQAKHSVAIRSRCRPTSFRLRHPPTAAHVAKLGGDDAMRDARWRCCAAGTARSALRAALPPCSSCGDQHTLNLRLSPNSSPTEHPPSCSRQAILQSMLPALENPGPKFGADPTVARDRLLLDTLSAAYRDTIRASGPDAAQWAWGRIHHGFFAHAVTAVTNSEIHRYNVGRLPAEVARQQEFDADGRALLSHHRLSACDDGRVGAYRRRC